MFTTSQELQGSADISATSRRGDLVGGLGRFWVVACAVETRAKLSA